MQYSNVFPYVIVERIQINFSKKFCVWTFLFIMIFIMILYLHKCIRAKQIRNMRTLFCFAVTHLQFSRQTFEFPPGLTACQEPLCDEMNAKTVLGLLKLQQQINHRLCVPRSGDLLLWNGYWKFYVMSSPEIDLYGIVHVKVDFIVVLKIYVLVILGRFV